MKTKKVLIVGFGSIGKRHSEILSKLGADTAIVSKRNIVEFPCFSSITEGISSFNPDVVFICNETSRHLDSLIELNNLKFSKRILCEKPIGSKAFDPRLLLNISNNLFVTYNLRFHPLIRKLKDELQGQKILTFLGYVGQYLPDWRPGTNYRESYSAKKEMGGGPLLDLSHEIDYANYLFGSPKSTTIFCGKTSSLEITTEDIVNINWLTKSDGLGFLSLNYLDKKVSRFLIVNTEKFTYKIDFTTNEFWKNNESEKITIDRNTTYTNMHTCLLNENMKEFCTYSEALEVMKIISSAQ